ncbi:MAG: peptidoglycan-binding protein [Acidimicrobiales bacterium]|nr:peptidoglycan-binding protein [Acidimicrobiales bacterium]
MADTILPLGPGDRGDAVRDLHRRLHLAGFTVETRDRAEYETGTESAVAELQSDRGLDATGIVDQRTWNALIEAGYSLGDRPLYRHSPMLRGDDVMQLQVALGNLGFDAGWIDGIFGPDTERALVDFQRNSGLPTDGIAGVATLRELQRFSGRTKGDAPVVGVRERDALARTSAALTDRRIVIGQTGHAPALANAIGRQLRRDGAAVLTLHDPDPSGQADAANAFGGEVYLGLSVTDEAACTANYWETTGFFSAGGQLLGQLVQTHLQPFLETLVDGEIGFVTQGKRLPILRETRMPALWCQIGPTEAVVSGQAPMAEALTAAVRAWCTTPVTETAARA